MEQCFSRTFSKPGRNVFTLLYVEWETEVPRITVSKTAAKMAERDLRATTEEQQVYITQWCRFLSQSVRENSSDRPLNGAAV